MSFWQNVLRILDADMTEPTLFGWYHLMCLGILAAYTVGLCLWAKKATFEQMRKMVLITAIVVTVCEIYKQINYTFGYENGITANYQWYAFPFQFCSTPMYIGLLAGLTKKGKVHDAACAYLATFSVFAGAAVMIYPGDVFVETIGINIQTMICHGTMISVGAALFAGGHVKLEHKTILKALPVFAVCVTIACVMNELAHVTGLLERESFNMFYFSPYVAPSLPVYSLVQGVVPFPWSLIIYIAGFTAAAYLMLLIAKGIGSIKRNKVAA